MNLPQNYKSAIISRCGPKVIADGIVCPYCNCHETYKPAKESGNTNKWFFMIKAFVVDNKSHCLNCDNWF